ncbi:MAG: hypothetical protein Kow0026_02760 [Oricola sp.]
MARGFRTDDERHLALGERHSAPAPHIDVVERDLGDAHRDLTMAGRGRGGQVHLYKFAVFHELQGAHGVSFSKIRIGEGLSGFSRYDKAGVLAAEAEGV